MDYHEFIKSKLKTVPDYGFDVPLEKLNIHAHEWQKRIVQWNLRRGRSALFADCGTGKALKSLIWSEHVIKRTNKPLIYHCPIAVRRQVLNEAEKFNIDCEIRIANKSADVGPGINVVNYEKMHHFDPSIFGGVVLDESSVLKAQTGKYRTMLTESYSKTPYKLACTATPSPNDHMELGNHAEFLGVCAHVDMLSRYFVHDSGDTAKWRLKGHAPEKFWAWVASWAICIGKPSDIGGDDTGYDLPELTINRHIVEADTTHVPEGFLFNTSGISATSMHDDKRMSLTARSDKAAELAMSHDDYCLIWCNTNYESDELKQRIDGVVEVRGSEKDEAKEEKLLAFQSGEIKRLLSKPAICGHGMNLQHCNHQVFASQNYCYDEETEVLTYEGWKGFGSIGLDDKLATVKQESLAFEWQHPTDIIHEPYDGDMIHFAGDGKFTCGFDLLVTPNHKMFVQRCPVRYRTNCGDWGLVDALDLHDNYKRQEYRMLSVPRSYSGAFLESVKIPLSEHTKRRTKRSREIESIDTMDFMMLAGWYLSEGHANVDKDGIPSSRIVICQTDYNPKNRLEIIALLKRLPGDFVVNSKTKDIVFCSKQLSCFLVDEFGRMSGGMKIPRWVKELDSPFLERLRDTMLKGDGCGPRGGEKRSLRTISKRLADDFQEICLKTGWRGSITVHSQERNNDLYEINISRRQTNPSICCPPKKIQYSGMIGCATVPNHTMIVRRRGIAVVSGNSWEQTYQAIRRCWRFGQVRPVTVDVVLADTESAIASAIARKDNDNAIMRAGMAEAMRSATMANITGDIPKEKYQPSVPVELPSFLVGELV